MNRVVNLLILLAIILGGTMAYLFGLALPADHPWWMRAIVPGIYWAICAYLLLVIIVRYPNCDPNDLPVDLCTELVPAIVCLGLAPLSMFVLGLLQAVRNKPFLPEPIKKYERP